MESSGTRVKIDQISQEGECMPKIRETHESHASLKQ
jgi:hypothetical protein